MYLNKNVQSLRCIRCIRCTFYMVYRFVWKINTMKKHEFERSVLVITVMRKLVFFAFNGNRTNKRDNRKLRLAKMCLSDHQKGQNDWSVAQFYNMPCIFVIEVNSTETISEKSKRCIIVYCTLYVVLYLIWLREI